MKKVLFVAYGSGHIRMVLAVAKAMAASGLAQPVIMGLTTAAPLVRDAGLELLQFKDFVNPHSAQDAAALAQGQRLMSGMPNAVADPNETAAYLGFSYQELEETAGAEEAAKRYALLGRQAFLPVKFMQRVISAVGPTLVAATNSPRAERAAIVAAGLYGLPSVCMVDLFCIDEVQWIGVPGYANKVCVLNASVKDFLCAAGRASNEVVVTGNPAFDDLLKPQHVAAGAQLRQARGWTGKRVLLWPTQVEPTVHPFTAEPGNVGLPERALNELIRWVLARPDCVLCVRPRAGEVPPPLPDAPSVVVTGQDIELAALLHAVDMVVTLSSTVGLEGHLSGTRLVQVLGSVFDAAMPLKQYGVADAAVPLGGLFAALDRCIQLKRNPSNQRQKNATIKVLEVIRGFL